MLRGRTRPSWHAVQNSSLWQLAQNCESFVAGVVEPARGLEHAAREHRLDATALLLVALHVAGLARRLRVTARGRVGVLMTAEAALHARELIARRELQLLDVAVALLTGDVPRRVLLVVEHHVRPRDLELRDRVAVAVFVAEVAEVALAAGLVTGLNLREIGVVGAVAGVADGRLRRELVVDGFARRRAGVARRAFHALIFDVELVVEADRQLLRREDRLARAGIVGERAGREPVGGDAAVVGHGGASARRRHVGHERRRLRRGRGAGRSGGVRLLVAGVRVGGRLGRGRRRGVAAGPRPLRERGPDRAEDSDDEEHEPAD